jgi:tetraacyldisaccharide 4'-kinase
MRRPWALPLLPLYRAAATLNGTLYDHKLLPIRKLRHPVLSVGSLSAGGAGKTPVVLALADLLQRHGFTVDVLSRGYRRAGTGAEPVDAAGSASHFGDEPLELAQAGLKVFVAAERFAAGTLAEQAIPPHARHLHLLDDGFQHRRLARQRDIVLLTRDDVHDWLLPVGNLREPLAALARAQIAVLREEDVASLAAIVHRHSRARIWKIRRELVLPFDLPRRPIVFCGIARPANLFAMLRAQGVEPAAELAFPDHHPYSPADLDRIAAASPEADGFLTTAKDAVKLPPGSLPGPVAVARLQVTFLDEAAALHHLRLD